MKRTAGYIAVMFLVVLSLAGCHRKGRVIPAKVLERIYVDMFLADQWILDNDEARRKADTTLFYEPLFRRYGYTSKDYDLTVSHYIDRPDKYVKILRRAAKELNIKHLEYSRIAERIADVNSQDRKGFGYARSDFHDADSILFSGVELDSILVRDSVYIKEPEPGAFAAGGDPVPVDVIVITQFIDVSDVEGEHRIRADKKPAPGKFPRHKPAPDPGENM